MPLSFRRILLRLVGIYCFLKAALVSTLDRYLLQLLDLKALSTAGRIEFISVYAGFFLGLGGFLFWSMANTQRRKAAFLLLALVSGGTLGYRIVLHLLWQTGGTASLLQLGGEILLCSGSAWAYWRER